LVTGDVRDHVASGAGRWLAIADPDRPQVASQVQLVYRDTDELAARKVVPDGQRD